MGSGFRTFQSGEVLTSSNVQNYLMDQAITVFSGTAARGSAIASPETGMVSYRTDGTADSKREGFEFYDGASWTRLVPATTTAGLELISSTTIGTAVSSVTVSNAFSATYDHYLILVGGGGSASTDINLNMTLGATATGYYKYGYYGAYNSATINGANGNNATSWVGVGSGGANGLYGWCHLSNPFLSTRTVFSSTTANPVTTSTAAQQSGYLDNTTSYTAFTFTTSSGTMTGGTIKVYGYKN